MEKYYHMSSMWEGCGCSMSGRVFVTGDTHGTIDIDKVIEFSKDQI